MSKSREKLLILSIVALVIAAMLFIAYSLFNRLRSSNRAPVIYCESDTIYVSVDATDEDLLVGVTALDEEDGDLTSSVVVGNISSFSGKGKCEITYAVFDSGNKVATAKRQLYYTDYHPPRFVLKDDFVFYAGESANLLKNVSAFDCIDGEISNRISMAWIENDDDSKIAEFQVINSRGDISMLTAQVTTVERSSQNAPSIALSDYLVYLEAGAMLDPLDYVKSITVSKKIYTPNEYGRDTLSYDLGDFNSAVPGLYRIGIFCDSGEAVGMAELLVMIEG